ncbi:hypothetical protein [Bacillus sp. AFS017336]|nr:hypothetical protein [Bacillus sp. AFS017336]
MKSANKISETANKVRTANKNGESAIKMDKTANKISETAIKFLRFPY